MYPFQRPNPLQQILDAVNGGQEIPMGGTGGYASPMGASASPPSDGMSALIARMTRAAPYQRQEEQPEATKKQKILAGIKDAIAAYVQAQGVPVSYGGAQDRIRATRERNAQIREQNRLGEARAAADADKQSALLEYQRLKEEKAERIRAAEREQDIAEATRRSRVDSSQLIAKIKAEEAAQERDFEHDKELAKLKGEIKVKEIGEKARVTPPKPDPKAKADAAATAKQQKKAEEITKAFAAEAQGIREDLAKGLMEPDDVRRRVQAEMDARNLTGNERQFVINNFAKHILPILKEAEAKMRTGG